MLKHVVVGIVSLLWSASVGAQSVTVCSNGCDYTSIQAAIDEYNWNIQLAAETYDEDVSASYGGIVIEGVVDRYGEPASIINGALSAYEIVVDISNVQLRGVDAGSGFTSLRMSNCAVLNGSGVRVQQGQTVALTGCTIANNTLGVELKACSQSIEIVDCNFVSNQVDGAGGGVSIDDNNYSTPYLEILIQGCTFEANTATRGGAIHCKLNRTYPPDFPNLFRINGCVFRNNTASDYGGAVCNWESSSPTFIQCQFTGNSRVSMVQVARSTAVTTATRYSMPVYSWEIPPVPLAVRSTVPSPQTA